MLTHISIGLYVPYVCMLRSLYIHTCIVREMKRRKKKEVQSFFSFLSICMYVCTFYTGTERTLFHTELAVYIYA